ncbi:hypothetical protein ACLOJK_026325 [Asimina triloba]
MKEEYQVFAVVASLIAPVTFAAAFTLPGGHRSSNEPSLEIAVLASKSAFKDFVLFDTLRTLPFFYVFAMSCYM